MEENEEKTDLELTKVTKIVTKGKAYPKPEAVWHSCMSYFNLYRTGNELDSSGVIEFTLDGLHKISDVGMYNAIGVTRQKWAAWKTSVDNTKDKKGLRDTIQIVEQILEQVDQERLSSRGNVGDVFRMKARHMWRDVDKGGSAKTALSDLSSDKTAEIIQRMTKK